jgi:hypothetical protein
MAASTLLVVLIALTAGVGSLYIIAAMIRNHAEAHDLKGRVASLRLAYYRRVQAQNEAGEVDVVEDEPAKAA